MKKYYIRNGNCGTETAFKIIGARWKPHILFYCSSHSDVSFSSLKHSLPGISDSILTKQLNELLRDEMLVKEYSVNNNKPSYKITLKTESLVGTLLLIEKLSVLCGFEGSGYPSKIEYAKKLIGSKWKSRIIWIIYNNNIIRFNELQNCIEGLSHKVLIEHLNALIQYDLIVKTDYNSKSPHVEYSLTDKGKMAYEVIQSLADWCQTYNLIKPQITIDY